MATQAKKLAIILIRGLQNLDGSIHDTLRMLNLQRRNVCVVVSGTPSTLGMIGKVKNYITYGEIDDETLKLLQAKKGEAKHYNLNSPKKGYGRKGIKHNFSSGGGLGYRGDKINDLIKRMI